jgi:hypothetical protein
MQNASQRKKMPEEEDWDESEEDENWESWLAEKEEEWEQ